MSRKYRVEQKFTTGWGLVSETSFKLSKDEAKKVLEELKELNDMGFSNKLICEILDLDIRVIQRFLKGKKPHEVNFIKLKEGLTEIRKQHES